MPKVNVTKVTLINKTARSYAIVLDHVAFQKRKYGFKMVVDTHVTENKAGTRSQRLVRKRIPGSITLPARGTLKNLHPAILGCAQVRTLEKQGRITVRSEIVEVEIKEEKPKDPAPARTRRSRVVTEPTPEQPNIEENDK